MTTITDDEILAAATLCRRIEELQNEKGDGWSFSPITVMEAITMLRDAKQAEISNGMWNQMQQYINDARGRAALAQRMQSGETTN